MQRSRARILQSDYDIPPPRTRGCDFPGCSCEGLHRAPKARDRLTDYYWFCLDHVREYNRAWDFYAGMSPDQIEAELRRDSTWQRPTWPMGFWTAQEKFLRDRVTRGFGFEFGHEAGTGPAEERGDRRPAARTEEEEALLTLDLAPPVDFARIKARYRELVKRHHPDANGGDREAEERLKHINRAYNTLKACYGG